MPSSERLFSTSYAFEPPHVEGERTRVCLYVVHEGRRLPLEQHELEGALRAHGVPVEAETVVEPASWVPPEHGAAVEAFHGALPPALAGSVMVFQRFALVETPTALGMGEHRRRRALVERFLRERGLSFTTECRVVLSKDACQPLPPEMVAPTGADREGAARA